MRYYGIWRGKYWENIKYTHKKLHSFFSKFLTFNKEKRKALRCAYEYEYHKMPTYHRNLAIPENKYYTPICIITSDLVLKENISQLKSGLLELLKNHYTHKLFGASASPKDLSKSIDAMDQTLISGAYWSSIGWCDFERNKLLKKYISYYDVSIRNINDSYLSIEFHIYPSDVWIRKQQGIINRDFRNKGHVRYVLTRNRKQSGAMKYATVTHYNDALMKSDELYRELTSLKWVFYSEINKYFCTVLHQKGAIPPSISCYKTNIHYLDESAKHFWESVGISKRLGQFEDTYAKLFFSTKISQLISSYSLSNMNYIVNDEMLTLEPGMSTIDFQIIYRLDDLLHAGILSLSMLDAVNDIIVKDISCYRSLLNKIKLKKNKYKKLLKLRYNYERDLDFFIRYACSEHWEYTKKEIVEFYSEVGLETETQYKVLFQSIKTKQMLSENIDVLTKDFNEKTSVLQHLAEYKNASRSSKVNWVMLIITGLTLILSIFPEFSKQLASILENIWIVMKEYIKKF